MDGLPLNNIKKLDETNRHNFSFIIKDDAEVVFFINSGSSELMAIWTDSKSFVSTLKSLFKLIWRKSAYVLEKENKFTKNMSEDYEHRLREIEQEKVILGLEELRMDEQSRALSSQEKSQKQVNVQRKQLEEEIAGLSQEAIQDAEKVIKVLEKEEQAALNQ